ncbi:MAG: lipoate--protein ligase [Candidatus Phytoplasma australasiaticum]|nr:lipoate--protein ligase [Candidatus Phytoplasma australasiaticum]MDV3199777.1 lipoate--protein ligase [Candidatus Phytoplasma australasiaticum]
MILVKYPLLSHYKPYFYYGLEEYILNYFLKNDDEIYFFFWTMQGVVIGRNQIIENEINLEFIKKNKIEFFRRPSGGGCVYNDFNTPIFSFIFRNKCLDFSFKKYLNRIIKAFNCLGIPLYFSGRNDILLQGKKVSGNAFWKNKNGIVMHGTLLYQCDINTMIRCITPNNQKLISKGIDSVRSRVVNLKQYLSDMTQYELIYYLENFLKKKELTLTDKDLISINSLALKYSSSTWLFNHPIYSKILQYRFEWGEIKVSLELEDGYIKKMQLWGDFFHIRENLDKFCSFFENILFRIEEIQKVLQNININDYILNASNQDFLFLLKQGLIDYIK